MQNIEPAAHPQPTPKRRKLPRYRLDRRTRTGKRLAALEGALRQRLGPRLAGNPELEAAVIKAATLELLAQELAEQALKGEPVADDAVRAARASIAAMRVLGLPKHEPERGPTLSDYLRAQSEAP